MSERWRQYASVNESENISVAQARLILAFCGNFNPALISVPQARVVSGNDVDNSYTLADFTAPSGGDFPDNVPVKVLFRWLYQNDVLAAEVKAALENNNYDRRYPGWRDFVTLYNISRKQAILTAQADVSTILMEYLKYTPEAEKALFSPFPAITFPV